jgi:hypothetical protein
VAQSNRRLAYVGAAVALVGLAVGYFVFRPAEPMLAVATSPAPAAASEAPTAERTPTPSPPSAAAVPKPPATDDETFPRDPDEWQGMLVSKDRRQVCRTSSQCGMALACGTDQQCGPCRTDSDCALGEGCVLDHCLPVAAIACHRRRDCPGQETICVLSGLSSDSRGNGAMKSECIATTGGREVPTGEAHYEPAGEPPVSPTTLLDSLHPKPAVPKP